MKSIFILLSLSFLSLTILAEMPSANITSREVIVKEDTLLHSYRLFNAGVKFNDDSLKQEFNLDFVNKNGESIGVNFTNVFDFSFYLQASAKTSFSIQLITSTNGVERISKEVNYTVYKDNGAYKQIIFNLPKTENVNDLKNVIGMKIVFQPREKLSSVLLDELVLSYLEEEKEDLSKKAFSKDKAKQEFDNYLDKKREEGFDHQRKIEASKNNR